MPELNELLDEIKPEVLSWIQGALAGQTVTSQVGPHDHSQFVRRDGTTDMLADWDAGVYTIQNDLLQVDLYQGIGAAPVDNQSLRIQMVHNPIAGADYGIRIWEDDSSTANKYGIKIETFDNASSAAWGLYMEDISVISGTAWSIYTNDGLVRFGDNVSMVKDAGTHTLLPLSDAEVGTPAVNSPSYKLTSNYWDGAASQATSATLFLVPDYDGGESEPLSRSLELEFDGTRYFNWERNPNKVNDDPRRSMYHAGGNQADDGVSKESWSSAGKFLHELDDSVTNTVYVLRNEQGANKAGMEIEGYVRIGTITGATGEYPTNELLELSGGGILLDAAANTNNGTIQYTGSDFEGRLGGAWISLTAGGGGGVAVSGTPVDNQIAIWVNANTIEGDSNLRWNGSTLTIESNDSHIRLYEDDSADDPNDHYQIEHNDIQFRVEFFDDSAATVAQLIIGDRSGNVAIGGEPASFSGAGALQLINGTEPSVSPTNAVQLYSKDESAQAAFKIRDEAGNIWSFQSDRFTSPVSLYHGGFLVWDQNNDGAGSGLDADLLDAQEGSYYLDSANFTGTDWTDLTDAGQTSLHTHPSTGIAPAGSDSEIQYNNGGVLGADAGLTWDDTNKKVSITRSGGPGLELLESGSSSAGSFITLQGYSTGVPSPLASIAIQNVAGTSAISSQINFHRSDSGNDSGEIRLQTRTHAGSLTDRVYVKDDGDVGVGGEPGVRLHVIGGDIQVNDDWLVWWGTDQDVFAGYSTAQNSFIVDVETASGLIELRSTNSGASQVQMATFDPDGEISLFHTNTKVFNTIATGIEVIEHVMHETDADTYLQFTLDQIDLYAGSVQMLTLTETTQDIVTVNAGDADVDFHVGYSGAGGSPALFVEGSSGYVGIDSRLQYQGDPTNIYIEFGTNQADLFLSAVPFLTLIDVFSQKQLIVNRTYEDIDFFVGWDGGSGTTPAIFARGSDGVVAVNTSATAGYRFSIDGASGDTRILTMGGESNQYGLNFDLILNASGTSVQGVRAAPTVNVTSNTAAAYILNNNFFLDGSATINGVYGQLIRPSIRSTCTGNAGVFYGLEVEALVDFSSGAGTVDAYTGLRILDISAGVAGTIRAVDSRVASGANHHNLYIVGTADNYLEGDTGIGVSSPSAKLHVVGDTYLNGNLGVGTASPDRLLHAEVSDAVTAAVTHALRLSHITSGTAAVGFGTGLEMELEGADGTDLVAGTIRVAWRDASTGSEDADMLFSVANGGVDADSSGVAMRLTTDGNLGLGVDPGTTYKLDVLSGSEDIRFRTGSAGDIILQPIVNVGYAILNSRKTTTGDATGSSGMIVINEFDNNVKMYADGAWRTLASW